MSPQQSAEPCIWLNDDAEAAIRFYVDLVPDSAIHSLSSIADPQGHPTVLASFRLGGVNYRAIGGPAGFALNEAFSISLNCADQAETDHYWAALSQGGIEGACGWVRDRWGLWWQVVPSRLGELLSDPNPNRAQAARQAMFGMSRIIIAEMEAAADAA